MDILGKLSASAFIERYWQKEPLLVRGALPHAGALIDGDELAGLACVQDIESRLIECTATSDGDVEQWRSEDGPFDEQRFVQLPPSHWTLLVNGLDSELPEFGGLLTNFNFLPRWRLDDIMVSYAVDGGGVGPHFDHYDVFLLQLSGKRHWRLGQRCDEHTALREDVPLKLLREFRQSTEYTLEAGDMLYVPPGLAHWGCALGDDCITASIGYRAPSMRALVERTAETLGASLADTPVYRDTAAAIDADPFRINQAALQRVHQLWKELPDEQIADALTTAFGALASETRQAPFDDAQEALDADTLAVLIDTHCRTTRALTVEVQPRSRMCWAKRATNDAESDGLLFVDGDAFVTSATMAHGVCHGSVPCGALKGEKPRALLLQLIEQGSLRVVE